MCICERVRERERERERERGRKKSGYFKTPGQFQLHGVQKNRKLPTIAPLTFM